MWQQADERGSGLVGTFLGSVALLAFLALGAHTLISLYATSVVTAVGWDGARAIAMQSEGEGSSADAAAIDEVRRRLHGLRDVEAFASSDADGSVRLTIEADRPVLVPAALLRRSSLLRIKRTVVVRREELQ